MRLIQGLADADLARSESGRLLNEIVKSVQSEGRLCREIDELREKLPQLESLLADQVVVTTRLNAERRRWEDEICRVEALLRLSPEAQ